MESEADRQAGLAWVVTLSAGSGERNIMLGQDGAAWEAQVRTTVSRVNGLQSLRTRNRAAVARLSHLVFTGTAAGRAVFT